MHHELGLRSAQRLVVLPDESSSTAAEIHFGVVNFPHSFRSRSVWSSRNTSKRIPVQGALIKEENAVRVSGLHAAVRRRENFKFPHSVFHRLLELALTNTKLTIDLFGRQIHQVVTGLLVDICPGIGSLLHSLEQDDHSKDLLVAPWMWFQRAPFFAGLSNCTFQVTIVLVTLLVFVSVQAFFDCTLELFGLDEKSKGAGIHQLLRILSFTQSESQKILQESVVAKGFIGGASTVVPAALSWWFRHTGSNLAFQILKKIGGCHARTNLQRTANLK